MPEQLKRQSDWAFLTTKLQTPAGQRFEAPITSFRSIEWESFRPNFFVVASPGSMDGYAASYITGSTLAVDGGFDATGVGLPALRRGD